MPKRKRITTVEELEPETPVAVVDAEPQETDEIEEAFWELADTASSFTVFRLPEIGQQGRRKFCATARVEDLSGQSIMEFVAERWGGGRYLISPRGERGSILKNQTIEIDKGVKMKADAPEPARDTSKSEMIELVREVLRERGNGGASNPAEMTAAIIASAGQQAAAMMGMIQPLIAQMAENTKPQTPPWEMLTPMLTAALEIGAEARKGGDGDGPGSYLPLVEKFASILDRATARGQVPGERKAINPPTKAAEPVPPSNPNEPGWVKGLRPYLPYVLQQAKDQVPPGFFLGELEQRAPRIVDWLAGRDPETWPAELVTYAPELTPYVAWIKELLEAIAEPDEDEEPGTEGGAVN